MKTRLVVIPLTTLLLLAVFAQANESANMVVNKRVLINSTTKDDIRQIFLGKTTFWGDGKKINACYLDDPTFSSMVIKGMLGRSEGSFYSYWNRQLFSGQATPPVAFKNTEEVIRFIEKNDGAICYLPNPEKYASDTTAVKLLAVK